jgi:hypothetical protein
VDARAVLREKLVRARLVDAEAGRPAQERRALAGGGAGEVGANGTVGYRSNLVPYLVQQAVLDDFPD